MLLAGGARLSVESLPLVRKGELFGADPRFAASPDRVRSAVLREVLRLFMEAAEVTSKNFSFLSDLSREFGFHVLSSQVSAFCNSRDCKDVADAQLRTRISGLEEHVLRQERRIESLEAKLSHFVQVGEELSQVKSRLARLTAEVE
jgi:uncharacterized coiled-coil protein SlyX